MSAQSSTTSESSSESSFSWNTIQDRLRDSIVAIQSSHIYVVDDSGVGNSNASGFVVDAEKGIILTNRHVMKPGPSYHKATFFNNIEVYLQPTYYDPIHDFAFYRYDPAELKGFKPKAIQLAPEKAFGGMEFRVLGNNCNEKMSVHSGELSQLDRNPPSLNSGFSDQNIFYIQASSTTNGGSSGSPVVNIEGDAIAMNSAGRTQASASYFISLERAVYALKYIRNGQVPPRGTMQTVFKHVNFTQAEKLGLSIEEAAKQGMDTKNSTGVLTVSQILPEGPAEDKLHVGDILISIDDTPITMFSAMAEIIDASVDKEVSICVLSNGQFKYVNVPVQDFYSVTPSRILLLAGAVIQDMSYILGCFGNTPISGVVICRQGYGFLNDSKHKGHRVIYSVNGKETPNLDAFIQVLQNHPCDKPIVFKARSLDNASSKVMFIDIHPRICHVKNAIYKRNNKTGVWYNEPYTGLTSSDEIPTHIPQRPSDDCTMIKPNVNKAKDLQTTNIDQVLRSTVKVCSYSICPTNGNLDPGAFTGNGLVISHKHGIVICSAAIVANSTSIVSLTFNDIARIPAHVAYSHPLYPVSFLKYNPDLLATSPRKIEVSELDISKAFQSDKLDRQDSVSVVFDNNEGVTGVLKTDISSRSICHPSICECCTINHYHNIEGVALSSQCNINKNGLGVICNSKGQIAGLYTRIPTCETKKDMAAFLGFDISLLESTCKSLIADSTCAINDIGVLDVEYKAISLEGAIALGVDERHINDIWIDSSDDKKSLFAVKTILQKREDGIESLEVGDVILKIDGQRVKHIDELAGFADRSSVELTIVRDMQEMVVSLPTTKIGHDITRQVVFWVGFYLQEPWRIIKQKTDKIHSQVFSFCSRTGSPGNREAQIFQFYITEINDTPIQTMDDLVSVVKQLSSPDAEPFNKAVASNNDSSSGVLPGRDVKIRMVRPNGKDHVITVHTNDHYMPAWRAIRGPEISDEWKMEYF
ncbi:hypothetical protein FB645_004057 [Coemansia sp. IMI 203386]|nr:hypothetical protein FB645_004057 [Coemansia sp. IMI 203386]